MINKRTMIRLMTRTRAKLKALKVYEKESYDSVINKLIKWFKSKKK